MKNKTFAEALRLLGNIFFNRKGEVNSTENEPDKRRTYFIDGVKITANLFFKKTGNDARQVVEDYIIKNSIRQLVKKD